MGGKAFPPAFFITFALTASGYIGRLINKDRIPRPALVSNGGPRPTRGNLRSVDYKGGRALKTFFLGVLITSPVRFFYAPMSNNKKADWFWPARHILNVSCYGLTLQICFSINNNYSLVVITDCCTTKVVSFTGCFQIIL